MTINYIDIFLLVLSVLIIFISSRRGIVISLISMARVVAGVPISFVASGKYSQPFYDNYIKQLVISELEKKITEQGTVASLIESIQGTVNSLPESMLSGFELSMLKNLSVKKAAEYLELHAVRPIATVVLQIIIFLIVFIAIMIVTGVVISLIKHKHKRDKNTPLRKADMTLGAVFGFVKAVVLVFAISMLAGMVTNAVSQNYANSNQFISTINSSKIISVFNEFDALIK